MLCDSSRGWPRYRCLYSSGAWGHPRWRRPSSEPREYTVGHRASRLVSRYRMVGSAGRRQTWPRLTTWFRPFCYHQRPQNHKAHNPSDQKPKTDRETQRGRGRERERMREGDKAEKIGKGRDRGEKEDKRWGLMVLVARGRHSGAWIVIGRSVSNFAKESTYYKR